MLLFLALSGELAAAESDEAAVAEAFRRRQESLVNAGCREGAGSRPLDDAAAGLVTSVGRPPVERAGAVYHAHVAIQRADSRAAGCVEDAATPTIASRIIYRQNVSPRDLVASTARLRAWGEPESAEAWHRLADIAATPRKEATRPEICRCMGEPVLGTEVVYGYPSVETALLEMLGEVVGGGCDPSAGGSLACPLGCWGDSRRANDPPPSSRRAASRSSGGVVVAVSGPAVAVDRWDSSAPADPGLNALDACLADKPFGQAMRRNGEWLPARNRQSDRCLVDWATANVADEGVDRAAVVNQE